MKAEAITSLEPTAGAFFRRIRWMESKSAQSDSSEGPGPLLNPLTGWEAASRWNSAAFEWMTQGFGQWLSLMTTSLVVPPQLAARSGSPAAKAQGQGARAVAAGAGDARAHAREEGRAKPKRPARPKAAARKSRRA